MVITVPLNTASSLLLWSNRVYVTGAVLTLASAGMVLFEKRSRNQGRPLRLGLTTEIVVIIAAFICLCGTVGAISFGNVVSHLKDIDLATYKAGADTKIAQANRDAASANEKAEEAKKDNFQLQGDLLKHEGNEREAEAKLSAKETIDYNHALEEQRATAQQNVLMAAQAHVSPVLTNFQIESLANLLTPYKGQEVILHSTLDTTVLRLKQSIAVAIDKAGITFQQNSMDAGALYQGVSVVVHSPQEVPPLANSLVMGLRSAGITVNTVSLDTVPKGKVAVYLGPN
jgi:hypothetical protein